MKNVATGSGNNGKSKQRKTWKTIGGLQRALKRQDPDALTAVRYMARKVARLNEWTDAVTICYPDAEAEAEADAIMILIDPNIIGTSRATRDAKKKKRDVGYHLYHACKTALNAVCGEYAPRHQQGGEKVQHIQYDPDLDTRCSDLHDPARIVYQMMRYREIMESLPHDIQRIIELSDYGFTRPEIADITGLSERTLSRRCAVARRFARDVI